MFIIENGEIQKILEVPKNVKPVIRFKSKISGNSIVKDLVQGNSTLQIQL